MLTECSPTSTCDVEESVRSDAGPGDSPSGEAEGGGLEPLPSGFAVAISGVFEPDREGDLVCASRM